MAPLLALLLLSQVDAAETHDHPAVKRWPKATITTGEYRAHESFKFPLKDGATKKVDGTFLLNVYRLPPRVTCAQAVQFFETQFKERRLAVHRGTAAPAEDVVWPAGRWISGEGKGASGGQLFVLAGCPADDFEGPELFLWVVENPRMQPVIEPDAAALADELQRNGRVALYGITFASGKPQPTQDSAKALAALAELLEAHPDWSVLIESHTNDAGTAKANLALSKKRADAVKAWLTTKRGVAAERLTADGLGDQKPLSPATTEIGRANNRRVEIVKR